MDDDHGSDFVTLLAKAFQALVQLFMDALAKLPVRVLISLLCVPSGLTAAARLLLDRYALILCQPWPQQDETPRGVRVAARPCTPHAPPA